MRASLRFCLSVYRWSRIGVIGSRGEETRVGVIASQGSPVCLYQQGWSKGLRGIQGQGNMVTECPVHQFRSRTRVGVIRFPKGSSVSVSGLAIVSRVGVIYYIYNTYHVT